MPDSYISRYLSYATLNEAPHMFHVWGGYFTISAAVGRRVWVKRGKIPTRANMYCMYVGEAGNGKSYAMGYPAKLLERALNPDCISYDAETPEGLIDHMVASSDPNKLSSKGGCRYKYIGPRGVEETSHRMIIIANEFIDFMRGERERWTGMLNGIYDKSPYAYRTKNSGTAFIDGPYFNILGALTTEVCKDLQAQQIINTGFGRRCIMQYGARQWDNPFAEPVFGDKEEESENWCVKFLKKLNTISGELVRTPDSVAWWKTWYDEHSRQIPKKATPYNKTWLNSKSEQVLKIAMLNSLSERQDMTITPEDFETALKHLNKMEEGLFMIFGGLGRNELAAITIKVLEFCKQKEGPVPLPVLHQAFFNDLAANKGFQEMDEMLRHLTGTGQLLQLNATVGHKTSSYFIAREFALDWFAGEEARLFGVAPSDSLREILLEERRSAEQVALRLMMEGSEGQGIVESGSGTEAG